MIIFSAVHPKRVFCLTTRFPSYSFLQRAATPCSGVFTFRICCSASRSTGPTGVPPRTIFNNPNFQQRKKKSRHHSAIFFLVAQGHTPKGTRDSFLDEMSLIRMPPPITTAVFARNDDFTSPRGVYFDPKHGGALRVVFANTDSRDDVPKSEHILVGSDEDVPGQPVWRVTGQHDSRSGRMLVDFTTKASHTRENKYMHAVVTRGGIKWEDNNFWTRIFTPLRSNNQLIALANLMLHMGPTIDVVT